MLGGILKTGYSHHKHRKSSNVLETHGNINLMTATFNMGNAQCDEIDNLVPKNGETNDGKHLDMIVLGLQESTWLQAIYPSKFADRELSEKAEKANSQKSGTDLITEGFGFIVDRLSHFESPELCVNQLKSSIQTTLGDGFYLVAHNKRAQLQLFVYARVELKPRIREVHRSVENTGFLHLFPNKGGLCVTFILDATKFAFISCHLTAHEGVGKCQERNDSIKEIIGGVRAAHDEDRFDPTLMSHHVFWMGDMNYRVTFDPETPKDEGAFKETKAKESKDRKENMASNVDEAEEKEKQEEEEIDKKAISSKRQSELDRVGKMIEREQWEDILALDELNRENKAGRALRGFRPLQPSFPPTFKRIRQREMKKETSTPSTSWIGKQKQWQSGLDNSDKELRFYDYKRMPSYTDRILVKSLPGFDKHVVDVGMESCEGVLSSDHKPVRAFFQVATTVGVTDIKSENEESTHIQIEISNLSAKGLASMDLNGTSDPYVYVFADPPAVVNESSLKLKSTVIQKNLNPVWDPDETLSITLNGHDMEGLKKNAHLFLTVWDEDTLVRDMSFDHDLIGLIAVSFVDIVDAITTGKPIVRTDTLMANGYANGTLSYTINAFLPESNTVTLSAKKKGSSIFNLRKQLSSFWRGNGAKNANGDDDDTNAIIESDDVEITETEDYHRDNVAPKPQGCCIIV